MCTRCAFIGGLAALSATPALAGAGSIAAIEPGEPQALEIAMPRMRRYARNVWIGRLSPHVWIHTTTHVIDGSLVYPANGAIVVDGNAATIIDPGWNDADAEAILRAWSALGKPAITKALVTHFHRDRLGGIAALERHGIPAYGNPLTIGLAIDAGSRPPRPLHELEKHPQRVGSVEAFFPGAGHTLDNVVAWIPSDGVLFGGCLIKAVTAPDLGFMDDADPRAWPATMRRLASAYAPVHVIPGHGTIAGDSIAHTTKLADEGVSLLR